MNARCVAVWFVAATAWLVAGAAAEEAESAAARKIIDRAIEAAGGREALKRYEKPFQLERKGKSFVGGDVDFTLISTTWLPDKIRTDQESIRNGQKTSFGVRFNGEKGLLLPAKREMVELGLRNLRDLLYSYRLATLLPLDDPQFKLAALDEIMLDGRAAIGVKVSCEDRPEVRLYFDKDAMTLVKLAREFNGTLSEQIYDDFAELDGLVYPKKVVQYSDGKKILDMETTEFKFLDKVDEAIFEQP
jgi:hypothetical protein